MNLNRTLNNLKRRMNDVDMEDMLHGIGLERRRSALESVLPAAGFLLLGAAIGAGIGMLVAPASGQRTRKNVEERLSNLREKIAGDVAQVKNTSAQHPS